MLGGLIGFAAICVIRRFAARLAPDALAARRARGRRRRATAGFWGEIGYRIERSLRGLERAAEVERTRLAQFVSAMEASPNGVLLLDAAEQIEWCNARAADHFGLDPQRDRRQRVTNLVRSPAFVALPAGRPASTSRYRSSEPRGPRLAAGD